MPEIEATYKCPVCLGAPLKKLSFAQEHSSDSVLLDYCTRCGGIWFDYGEVQQLRQIRQQQVLKEVHLNPGAYMMQCHQCHQLFNRNDEKCKSCGWKNILDCPVCLMAMQRKETLELCLDYCKSCKGVWIDNIELATIWNGYLHEVARHQQQVPRPVIDDDDIPFFVDVLLWSPDLAFGAVELTAEAMYHAPDIVEGAGELISNMPEVAGSMFEAVPELASGAFEGIGEAAGSIFEFIAEIIGGLFDGF